MIFHLCPNMTPEPGMIREAKGRPLSKISPTLLMLVISTCLVGCNSEASQQAEAQAHLDKALATLSQANAGYIPRESDTGDEKSLQVYRQETMQVAMGNLNHVLTLNAPQQKVQALSKLAEINASAALHETGLAADENAILGGRSTSLQGYLMALEGSSIRSAALQPQTEKSLAKLQEEIQGQNAQLDKLNAEAMDLSGKLDAVNEKVQAFQAKADEGNAKAQELREKAFVTKGDAMYDLQDKAAELERQAAIESAAGEQEQVIANDLAGKLALAQSQIDTTKQLLEKLADQVKTTRASTERQADASAKADVDSQEAAKTLAEEFDQIVAVHENAIQKRMADAGTKIDQAVNDLKQAVQTAQGLADRKKAAANTPMAQLQLLAAYVDQAHIASTHAMYLGDLAGMSESIALSIQRVSPDQAGDYQTRADDLAEAQNAQNAKAAEAIAAGQALALELAPEGSSPEDGDPNVVIALKQKDRLDAYSKLGEATVTQ